MIEPTDRTETDVSCPCGRGDPYPSCCGRFHAGRAAPTAEQLMRSRYSAFALRDADHLLRTWHPSTRPRSLELDEDTRWLRLLVEERIAGGPFDSEGTVTFTAVARTPAGRLVQRERSRFVREQDRDDARWFYVDGDELPAVL